jgi:N-acetyl-beta-hexosaminidase
VIDIDDIRSRWQQAERFLDERGRRLFVANEAMAQGHGGVTATAAATGLARSTINRGIAELRSGHNEMASGCAVLAADARARWHISRACRERWKR